MKLITSPDTSKIQEEFSYKIFLAGGISGCPDWQTEFIKNFKDVDDSVILVNPRRIDFDINNPSMSGEQIKWEFDRIEESDAMIFWFPEETLCPITLYELGVATKNKSRLYVGCHPNYKRKFDVVTQLSLCRPDVNVVFSLNDLFLEWCGDYS